MLLRIVIVFASLLAGCDSCNQAETRACCKTCTSGQPCGDSCIPATETCHKAPGCACAADRR